MSYEAELFESKNALKEKYLAPGNEKLPEYQ